MPDTRISCATSASPRLRWKEVIVMMVAIAAVKAVWAAIDHTLRVYMGDSMVFLQAGAEFSSPAARSYPYGWALYAFAFPFHSSSAILANQLLWSTLSASGLYIFLRRHLAIGIPISAVTTLLFATEPAQVFLERLVMAETAGLLALVATILLLAEYVRDGRLRWFVASTLVGLGAAALRTNFVPLVLGLGIGVPMVVAMTASNRPRRQRIIALATAWLVLLVAHLGYTNAYGRAVHQPAGYVATSGMFRIGLVAPLIRPEHFAGTGVSGDILQRVKLPLDDHWRRGEQIWANDGLWAQLTRESSDPERVARVITARAMRDDPVGLLKINLETLGGYFNEERAYWRMQDDIAVIPPDDRAVSLIHDWLGWDVAGVATRDTVARRYFSASRWWLTFCLFALVPLSLVALAAGWSSRQRSAYLLLTLASLGLVATHLLFVHIVSYRYLHPLPWFVLANTAAVIHAWRRPARENEDTKASSLPDARAR